MDCLDSVPAAPARTMLGLDFDGTLAPIVPDPEQAWIHPGSAAALARLVGRVGTVAVITGRPARTAVRLGGFDRLAAPAAGRFLVLGQYGVERWDAATGEYTEPPVPAAITAAAAELPELLARLDCGAAYVEDKGRAVAVHTRRMPDPDAAFTRLYEPVAELADRHGLRLEPGKQVLEIRAAGVDKGDALAGLVAQRQPATVVFCGDDRGDLAAFRWVHEWAREAPGERQGCCVFASAGVPSPLETEADVVVRGADGIATRLTGLADALESAHTCQ